MPHYTEVTNVLEMAQNVVFKDGCLAREARCAPEIDGADDIIA